MGKAIFLHDESGNHIYNRRIRSADVSERDCKNYFASLDGEFAIDLTTDKHAVLARDWAGSVPFHYMVTSDGDIITGNNIRVLMNHPEYNYRHVRAVRAGHVVTIPLDGRFTEKDIKEERYVTSLYDLPDIHDPIDNLGKTIMERLVAETEKRLKYTGEAALAFSGGIDSLSVALAIAELGRIKDTEAYCINTEGKGADWPNAQRAAKYLGMKLNEVRTSRQRTLDVIPHTINLAELYKDYDIFCAVACYLLGEEMKKNGVRNIFTGDGANEAFRDYTSWGCWDVDPDRIISREMGARILEGRKDSDPVRSPQLGDGYAKSASRGSKIFPYFGIDTFNPFISRSVATYIAGISLEKIASWDNEGQPMWKQRIMQAAFPHFPKELFPLKTRMQDGVGTTDVICHIRRSDLINYGREGGYAKYGRGALDSEFQEQNPNYYTDLFRAYFENMFINKQSFEDANNEWRKMLQDLRLDKPDANGWHLVEMSKQR